MDERESPAPREPDEGAPTPSGRQEVPEPHPRGTLFLMLVYLMGIVALWGYVYLEMLEFGP